MGAVVTGNREFLKTNHTRMLIKVVIELYGCNISRL